MLLYLSRSSAHECTCCGQKGTASRVCSIDVFIVRKFANSFLIHRYEKYSPVDSSDPVMCLPAVRVIAFSFGLLPILIGSNIGI